jgi:hypothetical protein
MKLFHKINIDRLDRFILDNLYPIYIIYAFFLMLNINTYLSVFLFVFICYYGIKVSLISAFHSPYLWFKTIFIGYILYNLFSIIQYSINRMPLSIYISDIINSITPMMFFYIGINPHKLDNKFYDKILWACIFCFTVGIYLYITLPPWYLDWKVEMMNSMWYRQQGSVNDEYYMEVGRFTSFFPTSYNTSCLGIISISIIFSYLLKYKFKMYYIFALFLSICAIILAKQRVAMVYALFIFSFYLFYNVFYKHGEFHKVGLIVIGFIIVCISSYYFVPDERFSQIVESVFDRVSSVNGAFDERTQQYDRIMKRWSNYALGHGLGSGGHAASQAGFTAVHDGNYHKLLFETGIIGFSIFAIIMIISIIRGIKYYKYLSIEIFIIFYYLAAMLGSNILVMRMNILPFWYCIGRIWNQHYLYKNMDIKDKI